MNAEQTKYFNFVNSNLVSFNDAELLTQLSNGIACIGILWNYQSMDFV